MKAAPYPWLESVWQGLVERAQRRSLPHALMLAGQRGLGKRTLAITLARFFLCSGPVTEAPCGHCAGCSQVTAGSHPDLHVIEPDDGKHTIKVDAVRHLIDSLGMTSQQGGYRLAVLAPAEAMTTSGANSLLKTLEEPPAGVIIVLVTHEPARLPATIRSRCQLVRIPCPATADAKAWLNTQNISDAAELLAITGGAPLAAQRLYERGGAASLARVRDQLAAVARGQLTPVDAAGAWSKEDLSLVTDLVLACVLDLIRVGDGGAQPRFSGLHECAQQINSEALHGFADQLLEQRRLTDHPLNAQLALESVFIGWHRLCPGEEGNHGR